MMVKTAGSNRDLSDPEQLRSSMFDGIFHDRLQGKGRKMLIRQVIRDGKLHLQARLETRLLNLQIGVHVLNLIGQGHYL